MAGEDTHALWVEYRQSGDQALRDRLILTYAPLVKYVAGRLGSDERTRDEALVRCSSGWLGVCRYNRQEPRGDRLFGIRFALLGDYGNAL